MSTSPVIIVPGAITIGTDNLPGGFAQNHLIYAANMGAWWFFYLSGTQQLSALYSFDFVTWTAPVNSPITLAHPHDADTDGRYFTFAYANIGGYDVVHMMASYYTAGSITWARFSLGTTWTTTRAESTFSSSTFSLGLCGLLDSSNYPTFHYLSNASQGALYIAGNADTGAPTWAPGSGSANNWSAVSTYIKSFATHDLGSRNLLVVCDNGPSTNLPTNLQWAKWNGSSMSAASNVFGSAFTATSYSNWATVARTTTDIHLVALTDNVQTFSHMRFNGTSWIAGAAIPNLTIATGNAAGFAMATDGTYVSLFAIDSTYNVKQCVWNGSTWGSWSTITPLVGTPRYRLACTRLAQAGTVGLVWNEQASGTSNLVGMTASISAPLAPRQSPAIMISNLGYAFCGTGAPMQGHVQYAQNQAAWWFFYYTSGTAPTTMSCMYNTSSNPTLGTWQTPTGAPFTIAAASDGCSFNFGATYANIASTDVVHILNSLPGTPFSPGNWNSYATRLTLGTTVTKTNETSTGISANNSPSGDTVGIDTSGYPYYAWCYTTSWAKPASNADPGAGSWTFATFDGNSVVGASSSPESSACIPLSGRNVLVIIDNNNATDFYNNLLWALFNGTTTGSFSSVFGSNMSTGIDTTLWAACKRTTSPVDVHVVSASDNGTSTGGYLHARFNGTTFVAGDPIPNRPQLMPMQFGGNVALESDGTYVYFFMIDNYRSVAYTKWTNGPGWGPWTVLEVGRTVCCMGLTVKYSAAAGGILVAWTEDYNISDSNPWGTTPPRHGNVVTSFLPVTAIAPSGLLFQPTLSGLNRNADLVANCYG